MSKEKFKHTKNVGFKVPEDYFESFESNLFEKIKTTSALEPKIDSGFKVPKNYFETFSPKVKSDNLINLNQILYLSGMAAAILLMFTLFLPKDKPSFDGLEIATIEYYLLNESYEAAEIAGLLNEDELSLDTFNVTLDSDEMETYILENTAIENLIDF